MTTVFTKIIKRELPATIVFENERIIAFRDIHPIAPQHILIVTKKEIPNLQSVEVADFPLIGEMVAVGQQIARELGMEEGYRFVTNNGALAGQEVPHLHFHLIGGRKLNGLG